MKPMGGRTWKYWPASGPVFLVSTSVIVLLLCRQKSAHHRCRTPLSANKMIQNYILLPSRGPRYQLVSPKQVIKLPVGLKELKLPS